MEAIKNSQLVQLHNHFYSHDSIGVFEESVVEIAKMGFEAVALTDHGTLTGVVNFVNNCVRNGLKPIIGNEFYLKINGKDETFHLTVLAKNYNGYKNLVRLNNIGKFRGSKENKKKRNQHVIYFEELLKHSEDLIVLSGCSNSPMQSLDFSEAVSIATQIKDKIGEDFYVEAMALADDSHLLRAKMLADALEVKHVITCDAHFLRPELYTTHDAFLKIVQAFAYDSRYNFFATPEEIIERTKNLYPQHLEFVYEGILNTTFVADKVTPFKFDATPKLPHIPNADERFIEIVLESAKKIIPLDADGLPSLVYCQRLQYELETILASGYTSYFLITKELIDVARDNGFLIGIGRGSVAGSLVSWVIGITNIDPIKYGLMFERFINPERVELPDIDTDIPSLARPLVIDYANKTYGALQIAAMGTWGMKSALNKFSGFFKLKPELVKMANESFDVFDPQSTKADWLADENYKALAATNEEFDRLIKTIVGQNSNISRHAGGVVILEGVEDIPFETAPDGTLIVAYSEGVKTKDLASVGGVKFDLLGLKALDILQFLKQNTGVTPPEPIDDDPVFELFRNGKTSGIFQFNGNGNIAFTKRVAPRTFADLVAINALYRKGTLVGGTAEYYLGTRESGKARLLHPEIDEILKDTFGCLVYQEDIMKLYAWACDKSFGQADKARKALTKYKAGVAEKEIALAELKVEMFEGMKKKGLAQEIQETLWNEMVAHSLYSFNKSHATAYAYIAWMMAWYKFYHPLQFAAACLNFRSEEEKQEFIFEIVSEGFEISPPNINVSTLEYTADANTLYMPLNSIHGVGDVAANKIIEMRPYSSYSEVVTKLPKRQVNKGTLRALYQCGAMRFEDDPAVLKLDDDDYGFISRGKIQKKYFKQVQIPTFDIMNKVNQANASPNHIAGCVVYKEMKNGKNGSYWRYYLAPSAICNCDRDILEIGDWFRAEKTNWGRIKINNNFEKL